MASVNKVTIIGNLGADPESRYMPNGDAVCNIRLATSESWKDKSTGEKKEAVEWHRVIFFRKLAEIAGQYLAKGSTVYIEGKLQTRKWQDKDGKDQYTTEIVANELVMLSKRDGDAKPSQPAQRTAQGAPRSNAGDFEDDIPFAPINKRLLMAL